MVKLNIKPATLEKLSKIAPDVDVYDFLGFKLDLENCTITDKLNQSPKTLKEMANSQVLSTLLTHYAAASSLPLIGKLIKFKDLPGGYAYDNAFIRRAIQPVADVFGQKPMELPKASELLGSVKLGYGDASVEITALKGIPLTYIVYNAEEYPASANILYDESASNYLPTEDLAVLGELTTMRLIEAKEFLDEK